MKAIKYFGAAGISLALLFSACSVEKRRYRPGYNVNKDKKAPVAEANKVPETPTEQTTIILPDYAVPPASADDTVTVGYTNAYGIYIVVGPRPDKKARKKYPMGM